MNSENKKGIQLILVKLKKLKRYDLCYEWMEEVKDGEYIKYEDIENEIIKLLKGK